MARIPAAELERLKQEIALERLVEASGVELKAHGADRIGHCPFHDDKTPSLVVSPKKNLWHCLGACQTGGTVIDWVMKSQGVEYRKHYRPFPQVHRASPGHHNPSSTCASTQCWPKLRRSADTNSVLQRDYSTVSTLETIATRQRVSVAATGLTLVITRLSGEQAGLGRRPARG